jgi:outer membrane beta-barrel protein
MKQARPVASRLTGKILLLSAALLLLPSTAFAQKKGGGKPKTPAAAPAAGTEIDLDSPAPAAPAGGTQELDAPVPGTAAATPLPAGGGEGGGICDIDPSACPKASDIKAAAGKEVNAEIYAVQQIYALRYHRIEINPYWMFTLNDQFVSHPGPGVAINYYISNVLAVGVNGNLYTGLNGDSDFNFQNRRATRVAVPLNEYQWGANLNFTYVPVYGKFAGFGDFIFHYDAYVVGGVGALSTRPIAVIDPDNRSFAYAPKLAFNAGIGLRIFLNRWFAANLEVRDYIYNEKLESLTVGRTQADQQNKATWFGDNKITNNVQAQIGVSIFIPFSWEYRLPK